MDTCPIVYVFAGLLPLVYVVFRWLVPETTDAKPETVSKPDIVLENILSRRTISPKNCNGQRVTDKELEMILEAGNWAPTHQKTEPWRYAVFAGPEGILDYLEWLEEYYVGIADTLSQPEVDKFRMKVENARQVWVANSSHVIVIGMKRHAGKVPDWEEISAVAMSVQNMHLMASALDIGGFWSSHTWCRRARDSAQFKKWALDLTGDDDRAFGAFVIGKVDPVTKEKIRSSREPIKDKVIFKTSSS